MPCILFHFQLKVLNVIKLIEQILQRGNAGFPGPRTGIAARIHLGQFGGGILADTAFLAGGAVHGQIVHQHGNAVFRQHQIQLKVPDTMPVGMDEAGHGVFRSLSFGSTVTINDHSAVVSLRRW